MLATGYWHPEEKVFCRNGQIIRVKTIKYYPPDTAACIFWLKNRRPNLWSDRVRDGADIPSDPVFTFDIERPKGATADSPANTRETWRTPPANADPTTFDSTSPDAADGRRKMNGAQFRGARSSGDFGERLDEGAQKLREPEEPQAEVIAAGSGNGIDARRMGASSPNVNTGPIVPPCAETPRWVVSCNQDASFLGQPRRRRRESRYPNDRRSHEA